MISHPTELLPGAIYYPIISWPVMSYRILTIELLTGITRVEGRLKMILFTLITSSHHQFRSVCTIITHNATMTAVWYWIVMIYSVYMYNSWIASTQGVMLTIVKELYIYILTHHSIFWLLVRYMMYTWNLMFIFQDDIERSIYHWYLILNCAPHYVAIFFCACGTEQVSVTPHQEIYNLWMDMFQ